ncbi:MAG: ATP-binding protein [Pseudomonadota bacterium]
MAKQETPVQRSALPQRAPRWLPYAAAFVFLTVWLTTAFFAANQGFNTAQDTLRAEARNALALQAETLRGVLEKYRYLPPLLAHRTDVKTLFAERDDEAALAFLVDTAGLSGAADVGLLATDGSLNHSLDTVLQRQDLDTLSSLIIAPLEGRLGRTLLQAGGQPFYAFTYGVRETIDGPVVGVIAIVLDLEGLTEAWQLALEPIFLTAPDGSVILGNDLATAYFEGQLDAPLQQARHLSQTDWTLHVRRGDGPAHAAWRRIFVTVSLLALLVATIGAAFWWRWRSQQARLRRDRVQALRLERRVRDRTRELANANEALKLAQDELVETAKLAALGRMSAALAHEYNQPLAAVRTYADNAAKLLERQRPDEAAEALGRIGAVTDRMTGLSKALRSFARAPGQAVGPVTVAPVVDEVRLLIEPVAQKANVAVDWPAVDHKIAIRGGPVRLSQILVNLLSNAVLAADKDVLLSVVAGKETVTFTVKDDGQGVTEEDAPFIFEPFFTTRPVGEGLGLGLSIAYNIAHDFGGTLRLKDPGLDPETGATFELALPRVKVSANGDKKSSMQRGLTDA